MAYPDTVAVTPGAGAGIAVDTAGGAKFQVVKLDVGATGLTALLGSANPLPAVVQALRAQVQALTWKKIDSAAGGTIQLVAAAGAGKITKCYAIEFTLASPTTVQFGDSTPTTFTGAQTFGLGGGKVLGLQLGPNGLEPWYVTAANKDFQIVMGGAIQISGQFAYITE